MYLDLLDDIIDITVRIKIFFVSFKFHFWSSCRTKSVSVLALLLTLMLGFTRDIVLSLMSLLALRVLQCLEVASLT